MKFVWTTGRHPQKRDVMWSPYSRCTYICDHGDLHEEQYGDARVGQVPVDERVEQQVDGEERELDDQHRGVPELGQLHIFDYLPYYIRYT